jgi:UDP-N-acetylglucosamine--N-acetylmuramyl-(pentapeptide) pyrophosphoryl-undecaprenol N-acetylglucosamine transferase
MAVKLIISGGGTGGHIFPAISIANAIRAVKPDADILFVGAEGKMEMEKVPAAGYRIEGLPVAGFQRRLTFKNVTFFFKLVASLWKARRIIAKFKPDVVVGVGGYASGPLLRQACKAGIPCLIQEQNSYPGVTNRILAAKVNKICVAYAGMERFFPASKIVFTGNPVRQDLLKAVDRAEAARFFGMDASKPVILVIGGSLGARSINNGIAASLGELQPDVQLMWQTGKLYHAEMVEKSKTMSMANLHLFDFIQRMDLAFGLADVVISRAGASSISELAVLGKAAIFVPSPNVSEDHQTKNAQAMANEDAAVLVRDAQADTLIAVAQDLLHNSGKTMELGRRIREFARPEAAHDIALEVLQLIQNDDRH